MENKFLAFSSKKLKLYWKLIKSYQTGLLLITGITGYISARCPVHSWSLLSALAGSLFLAISGSTILNMFYDRDIDAKMPRTMFRPLPSGNVTSTETLILGLTVSLAGILWSFDLSYLYGVIILSGLLIDVLIYTIWLKRRTPWSIIFGGISGGMPILAGRVLGVGGLDYVGLLFSFSILLWIPTHILTFSIKYNSDYSIAGIPTFPNTYGTKKTQLIIGISSLLAPISIAIGSLGLGISWGYLRLLTVLSIGILILIIASLSFPSEKINFALFKYASIYMLLAMIIMSLGILL